MAARDDSLKNGGMKDTGTSLQALPLDMRTAKFRIGQVVKHRIFPFRGVIFDIDPIFSNTEEWWLAIPAEVRPNKDQPFYHLFAENAETEFDEFEHGRWDRHVSWLQLRASAFSAPLRLPRRNHPPP